MNLQQEIRTQLFTSKLNEAGFLVTFSEARKLEEEEHRLEKWLNEKSHGEMNYMSNHFDVRLDPRKLVNDAKTVISLSYNYFPQQEYAIDQTEPKISKYAFGKDYHKVIKKKLKSVLLELQNEIGQFNYRIFVDSAPILEKKWAELSGLGWVGKHTNLIQKENGSFFFLAEIVTDIVFNYGSPIKDYCGTCTRCIDACPTSALTPYHLDAKKCISYLTIELKESIPSEFKEQLDGWVFGCDVCQDVCPWNRFSKPTKEEKFTPNELLINKHNKGFFDLSEQQFENMFNGTPLRRAGYMKFKQNLDFIR